jgi:hypothetical protein
MILLYYGDGIPKFLKFIERFCRVNISNIRNIFCSSGEMFWDVDLYIDMIEINSSFNEITKKEFTVCAVHNGTLSWFI